MTRTGALLGRGLAGALGFLGLLRFLQFFLGIAVTGCIITLITARYLL